MLRYASHLLVRHAQPTCTRTVVARIYQLPCPLLHHSCTARSFASKSRKSLTDGSTSRRIDFEQLEDGSEYGAADEEAEADAALWKEISGKGKARELPKSATAPKHQQQQPPQTGGNGVSQSSDVELSFDPERSISAPVNSNSTSSSNYQAYRPYSEPRAASLPADSSITTSPSKPKYTSSRLTPAQLAFKSQPTSTTATTNMDTSTTGGVGRRAIQESKDASARSKYAARHGLLNQHTSTAASPSSPTSSQHSSAPSNSTNDAQSTAAPHRSSNSFQPTSFSSDPLPLPQTEPTTQRYATKRSPEGFQERVEVSRDHERNNRNNGWSSSINRRDDRNDRFHERRSDGTESSFGRDRSPNRTNFDDRDGRDRPNRSNGFRSFERRDNNQSHDRSEWSRDRPNRPQSDARDFRSNRDRFERGDRYDRDSNNYRSDRHSSQFDRGYERSSYNLPRSLKNVMGELLFGYHPVISALMAQKRPNFYRLYLQENKLSRITSIDENPNAALQSTDDPQLRQVLELAQQLQIPISYVSRHDMNLATENRPHNGFILDVAPLALKVIHAPVDLTPYLTQSGPQIWLLLDEVMDPQNIGAMLRSAWYFGVNGVLVCGKNSAPLSPFTSKASSGAQEVLQLLEVGSTPRLLHKIRPSEWNVVGLSLSDQSIDLRQLSQVLQQRSAGSGDSLTTKHTLLVIGNEGRGLRPLVAQSCHLLAKIVGTGLDATDLTHPHLMNESQENEETNMAVEQVNQELKAEEEQVNQEDAASSSDVAAIPLTTTPPSTTPTIASSAPSAAPPTRHIFVDSLNVSNALAVALYELTRNRV